MTKGSKEGGGIDRLIRSATELIPVLDRSILRLRYSQGLPGVSPLEYRILDYVCYHGPVRLGDIGAISGLSFPNASRYVKDLAAKGLLETSRDPEDGRALRVGTTAQGRVLLDRAEAAIRDRAKALLGKVGKEERAELERCLRDLSRLLEPLAREMDEDIGRRG